MAETIFIAPERIDRLSSGKVQEELDALLDGGVTDLVVDMKDLKYLSSAGLRVLLGVQKRIGKDGTFILANVPGSIRELLDVTGLSAFMKMR